jgi:hypothetical protein
MNIQRYNPNPLWWWVPFVNNKEGKFCEYRDYVKLEAENKLLKEIVNAHPVALMKYKEAKGTFSYESQFGHLWPNGKGPVE